MRMSSDKVLNLSVTLRRHLTGGMLHDMQGIVADQGRKKHRVELKLDSSSSARGGLQTAHHKDAAYKRDSSAVLASTGTISTMLRLAGHCGLASAPIMLLITQKNTFIWLEE